MFIIPSGVRGLAVRFATRLSVRQFHTPRNILKLVERGLIHDVFPQDQGQKLAAYLEAAPRTFYAGFDPTADSLHIGNLLVIIALLHCQRAGHNVVALIGGATGRIGDPSGKSEERPFLQKEVVQSNVEGIKRNLTQIFANHLELYGDNCKQDLASSFRILDNYEWFKKVNIVDFMAQTGRYFRVGTMLRKKTVKDRVESESGLTFTEFSYQIFQSYDWLHLLHKEDCTIQIGGSDQMGNIVAGQELISRVTQREVYGVLLPLVTSEAGNKLGKTAGNPVWLAPDKTSVFDFYQYFVRLPDADAKKLLPMFSFLPQSELNDLNEKHSRTPEKRYLQKKLAEHVTLLVHGRHGLNKALKATRLIFDKDVEMFGSLQPSEIREFLEGAAYVRMFYEAGLCILDFALKLGCFSTESDAIRIITAGGFYINEARHQNTEEVILPGRHILPNQMTLVRVGKKNYYIVEWTV